MKKLIFGAAVLASAFFAASCQQEMLDPQAEGTTVTYSVEVPDAIATKAIGDVITAVDKVYYEVYRAGEVDDLTKTPVYEGVESLTNNQASFDLEFVKDQEFVVLFWAQNSELVNTDVNSATGMYNINDLRDIKLVNPGSANNAAAQVFAGKDTVSDCVSAVNGNVTLTRPVSQINVYTTTESLSFGDVTIGLSTSDMTVAGLYNTYNVATGDAVETDENESTFVYAEAAVPTATADNAALKYVAMNYVGFAPKNGTTVNVGFNIQTTEAVKIEHSVANVPVKPNYRTNIVGNLITATADYNVSLDDKWTNTEEINYSWVAVTVPENNTEDVVLNTETIEVVVPASAAEAGATYKIVVNNESVETDNATGETTVGFDLTMYKNDVKVSSGDAIYEVTKNIGTDKFISEVTHNGIALTKADTGADQTYTYDSFTGVLTIYTKSFSPFTVTYADSKDYVRKLNIAHTTSSYISVSTGRDFLPIVAVNPQITGYSVFDGDTRITDEVRFRFSEVKKETINEKSYKVSFKLEIKDDKGEDLVLKPGMPSTINGKEYLHVYMNLIEVPEYYSVAEVRVGGTSLTETQSGNPATGEYWIGSEAKDVYFQSQTAGLVEVILNADYNDYVRKLNIAHTTSSYLSVSTGRDFLPIVAVNPQITGYSVFDGDTRITDAVTFRFSEVKKETINDNSYKVSYKLEIKDDKGEDLVLKPGMPSTINGKEYLHVYMNLIEVPEYYSVAEVRVGGTSLTETQSGNPATGEYWIGSEAKDIYFQSQTAGLVEVVVAK